MGKNILIIYACPGDLKELLGQAIITTKNREKLY